LNYDSYILSDQSVTEDAYLNENSFIRPENDSIFGDQDSFHTSDFHGDPGQLAGIREWQNYRFGRKTGVFGEIRGEPRFMSAKRS